MHLKGPLEILHVKQIRVASRNCQKRITEAPKPRKQVLVCRTQAHGRGPTGPLNNLTDTPGWRGHVLSSQAGPGSDLSFTDTHGLTEPALHLLDLQCPHL